jgi:hypothetical protein
MLAMFEKWVQTYVTQSSHGTRANGAGVLTWQNRITRIHVRERVCSATGRAAG